MRLQATTEESDTGDHSQRVHDPTEDAVDMDRSVGPRGSGTDLPLLPGLDSPATDMSWTQSLSTCQLARDRSPFGWALGWSAEKATAGHRTVRTWSSRAGKCDESADSVTNCGALFRIGILYIM